MKKVGIVVVSLSLLLVALPAKADEVLPPEAKARMDEGYKLLVQRKNAQAKEKFLQSLAIFPSAKGLGNLAAAEEDLGQYAEALGHVKALLVHPKAPPEDIEKIRKDYLPHLMSRTGHIRVLAVAGQAISLNGKVVGVAPLADTIDVNPGVYSVSVTDKTVEAKLEAGQSLDLDLRDPKGNDGGTVVKIDLGHKDPDKDPDHGHEHHQPPPQTHSETYRPTMGWVVPGVLLGVSAVGLGGGIAFGAASSAAKTDAEALAKALPCRDRQSASCTAFQDKLSSQDSRQTLSLVSYTVSGVILAGAVVSFIVWPKATREVTSIRVAPTLGGVQVVGTF